MTTAVRTTYAYLNAQAGDFHLAFDTTLGVPWDPPTTAAYWRVYGSFVNAFAKMSDRSPTPEGFTLKHPMNFTQFGNLVGDVLVSTTEVQRQSLWAKIYTVVHEQAILAPLSYLVNVAVVRDRFENFVFGYQQYDMQLHKLVDRELLGAAANANVATSPQLSKGAIAAIVVCSIAAATAIAFVAFLVHRERSGKPMFSRLIEESHRENAKGGFGMSHSAGEPDVVTKAAKTSNGTAV